MKIGILGMARSGISAAKKALSLGNDVFLSDSKSESEIPESKFIKENFNCEFGGHSDKLFNMAIYNFFNWWSNFGCCSYYTIKKTDD